jgi:hypothetical protein
VAPTTTRTKVAGLALVMLTLLAACGGGSTDDTTAATTPAGDEPATDTTADDAEVLDGEGFTVTTTDDLRRMVVDRGQPMGAPLLVLDDASVVTTFDTPGTSSTDAVQQLARWDLETGTRVTHPIVDPRSVDGNNQSRSVLSPAFAAGDVWVVQPPVGQTTSLGAQIKDPIRIARLDGESLAEKAVLSVPNDEFVEVLVAAGDGLVALTRTSSRASATGGVGASARTWSLRSIGADGSFGQTVALGTLGTSNRAQDGSFRTATIAATPDGDRVIALLGNEIVVFEANGLREVTRTTPELKVAGSSASWQDLVVGDDWVVVATEGERQVLALPDLSNPRPLSVDPRAIVGDTAYAVGYRLSTPRSSVVVAPTSLVDLTTGDELTEHVDCTCDLLDVGAHGDQLWILTDYELLAIPLDRAFT